MRRALLVLTAALALLALVVLPVAAAEPTLADKVRALVAHADEGIEAAEQNKPELMRAEYFEIDAIAQPGVPLEKLEAAIDAEIKKLSSETVSAAELLRAQNQFETGFVARLQSIHRRAMTLNLYETFTGDPAFAEKDLDRYRSVTPASLLAITKNTLDPNARVIMHIIPEKKPEEAK